jgi:hypothetical protein
MSYGFFTVYSIMQKVIVVKLHEKISREERHQDFQKKNIQKILRAIERLFEPIHSSFSRGSQGLHVESFFSRVGRFGFCHADRVGVNFLEQIEVFLFKLFNRFRLLN